MAENDGGQIALRGWKKGDLEAEEREEVQGSVGDAPSGPPDERRPIHGVPEAGSTGGQCGDFLDRAVEGELVEVALARALPVAKQVGGDRWRKVVGGRRFLDEDNPRTYLEARGIALGLNARQEACDDHAHGEQGAQAENALSGCAA